MAAALSLDLRERVIAAIDAGAWCRQAAERYRWGQVRFDGDSSRSWRSGQASHRSLFDPSEAS